MSILRKTEPTRKKPSPSPQAQRAKADAEKAFQLYLDMGPERSLARLQRLLELDHPQLAAKGLSSNQSSSSRQIVDGSTPPKS